MKLDKKLIKCAFEKHELKEFNKYIKWCFDNL